MSSPSTGFGNVALDVGHEQLAGDRLRLGDPLTVEVASGSVAAVFARTFADVGPGEPLLYEDSSRMLSLAVNRGSAERCSGSRPTPRSTLRPA